MKVKKRFWTGVVILGFILLIGVVGRTEFDAESLAEGAITTEEELPMNTAAGIAAGGVILVFGGTLRLFELSPPRNRRRRR